MDDIVMKFKLGNLEPLPTTPLRLTRIYGLPF